MKYKTIIGWLAALGGVAFSSAPAQSPETALAGVCYEITCSPAELQAETERCEKLLKQKGEAAAAKPAKAKSRKKGAEPAPVVVQWDAPKMARHALLGRAMQHYLGGKAGAELAGTPSKMPLYLFRLCCPLVRANDIKTKLFAYMDALPEGRESVGLVAVYRAWVLPPKGGKYRFVGAGTDFMIVRMGGKVVLEAGEWLPLSMKKDDPRTAAATVGSKHYLSVMKQPKKGPYVGYAYNASFSEIPTWNSRQGGLTLGTPFDAAADKPQEMEVIVASVKGEPEFGFALYVEDMAAPVKPGKPYPLFRSDEKPLSVQETTTMLRQLRLLRDCDKDGVELPPYDETGAPWKVVPPPGDDESASPAVKRQEGMEELPARSAH